MKENTSLMKLLDEIGVSYDIVFNKFDQIDEEEREGLKTKIHSEIQTELKRVNKVYFISAKFPDKFTDWCTMVNDLIS